MAPDALGWHAELALDASHDWNLQLGDEAGTWRLRGRLPRGQHAAHLGAALETQGTPGPTTPASTAANRFPPPLPPPPSTNPPRRSAASAAPRWRRASATPHPPRVGER